MKVITVTYLMKVITVTYLMNRAETPKAEEMMPP
jgi:hypothetical protein